MRIELVEKDLRPKKKKEKKVTRSERGNVKVFEVIGDEGTRYVGAHTPAQAIEACACTGDNPWVIERKKAVIPAFRPADPYDGETGAEVFFVPGMGTKDAYWLIENGYEFLGFSDA